MLSGKLIANISAILLFVNAVAASLVDALTPLSQNSPRFGTYVAASIAVSAFITPFLPRIQQIGATITEAQQ